MIAKDRRSWWVFILGFVVCAGVGCQNSFGSTGAEDEANNAKKLFLAWLQNNNTDGFANSENPGKMRFYSLTHVIFPDQDPSKVVMEKMKRADSGTKSFIVFKSEPRQQVRTDEANCLLLKAKMRSLYGEDSKVSQEAGPGGYVTSNVYKIYSRPFQPEDELSAKEARAGSPPELSDMARGCMQVAFWIRRTGHIESIQIIQVRAVR